MRKVCQPESVHEAIQILQHGLDDGTPWTPIACTSKTLEWMDSVGFGPPFVLDVAKISSLSTIRESEAEIHLGALASLPQTQRNPIVQKTVAPLACAARWLSKRREPPLLPVWMSTVLEGSPSPGALSIFAACDTEVTLVSRGGLRSVAWGDFFESDEQGRSMAWDDEIVTQLSLVKPLWVATTLRGALNREDRPVWSLSCASLPKTPVHAGGARVALAGWPGALRPSTRLRTAESALEELGVREAVSQWASVSGKVQDELVHVWGVEKRESHVILGALRALLVRSLVRGVCTGFEGTPEENDPDTI